ncbi:MAG TPA: hypothetical protein VK689_13835 [Armatimonadota bacterium]|nr:hypothetical protein [Armatimonadota bacterium]
MDTTLNNNPSNTDAVDAEAALDYVIGQIREIREQMKADDAEIARLKLETAELKAETRAILALLRPAA